MITFTWLGDTETPTEFVEFCIVGDSILVTGMIDWKTLKEPSVSRAGPMTNPDATPRLTPALSPLLSGTVVAMLWVGHEHRKALELRRYRRHAHGNIGIGHGHGPCRGRCQAGVGEGRFHAAHLCVQKDHLIYPISIRFASIRISPVAVRTACAASCTMACSARLETTWPLTRSVPRVVRT